MICEYTTNLEDFKAAQRLCIKRSPTKAFSFYLFQRVLPVLAIALLAWDILHRHFGFPPLVAGILGAVAWIGLYCPIMYPIQIRRLYRAMKNGRDDSAPLILEWNEHEMISRVPGLSEGRFLPAAIRDFAEDDNIALIFFAKNKFLMVPKRAMSESGWQELRHWMAKRGEATS
jgi:hypothetical protein